MFCMDIVGRHGKEEIIHTNITLSVFAAACMPGEFLIVDSNKCSKCAYGFFQNEKWQETCKKCNDKLTTYKLGAASEADCLRK